MRCRCYKCHYNNDGYCREPDYVSINERGECDRMFIKQTIADRETKGNPAICYERKCSVGDTLYVLSTTSPTGIEEAKCKRIGTGWTDVLGHTVRYYVQVGEDDRKPRWIFHNYDFGAKVFANLNDALAVHAQNSKSPCNIGDRIPYQLRSGQMIYYIVEKIRTKSDGTVMIRCKHFNDGENRSFTVGQARKLVKTNGREM